MNIKSQDPINMEGAEELYQGYIHIPGPHGDTNSYKIKSYMEKHGIDNLHDFKKILENFIKLQDSKIKKTDFQLIRYGRIATKPSENRYLYDLEKEVTNLYNRVMTVSNLGLFKARVQSYLAIREKNPEDEETCYIMDRFFKKLAKTAKEDPEFDKNRIAVLKDLGIIPSSKKCCGLSPWKGMTGNYAVLGWTLTGGGALIQGLTTVGVAVTGGATMGIGLLILGGNLIRNCCSKS